MYRLIVVTGFFLSVLSGIRAQDLPDFATINRETYRFYTEQKWDSLLTLGKAALQQEIDYFYLRMRMGIALYTKNRYRKAAGHFKQALTFNQHDPAALEYLYYSRLLSGQSGMADHVRKRFRGDPALQLPPPGGRFLDRFSLEYLYSNGVDDGLFEPSAAEYMVSAPGVQYTTRYFHNVSLSLVNALGPGIRLVHAYNYLSESNHYFYSNGTNFFHAPDQHLYQHQYYISPRFTTPAGSRFMPMFHAVHIGYQAVTDFGQGYMGGALQWSGNYLTKTDIATGLGFRQAMGYADLELGAWYSRLNGAQQLQNRLGFTIYPLGNLNLYAGGFINSQYETLSGVEGVFRLIPEVMLGFAIAEKVWFDLKGTMGEMTNYLENNGMIVYNGFSQVIDKKIQGILSIPVSEKGSLLYLGGRWTASRSEFSPFEPALYNIDNSIAYNTLSIYGGLSWKF